MSDAQYGFFKVLRGYENFEDIYQGLTVDANVIPLGTTKLGLDPEAADLLGKLRADYRAQGAYPVDAPGNGISPFLMEGVPVPIGSTLKLWLPRITFAASRSTTRYFYLIAWRIRSAQAYERNQRSQFHSPFDGAGPSDDGSNDMDDSLGGAKLGSLASARRIMYSGWTSSRYAQTEPTSTGDFATQRVYPTKYTVDLSTPIYRTSYPGIASGTVSYGNFSQGIYTDPTYADIAPFFDILNVPCEGDELLICLGRENDGEAYSTWDFTDATQDQIVSRMFGRDGYTNAQGKTVPLSEFGVLVASGSPT